MGYQLIGIQIQQVINNSEFTDFICCNCASTYQGPSIIAIMTTILFFFPIIMQGVFPCIGTIEMEFIFVIENRLALLLSSMTHATRIVSVAKFEKYMCHCKVAIPSNCLFPVLLCRWILFINGIVDAIRTEKRSGCIFILHWFIGVCYVSGSS